jgi:DNA-binding IclR family transcriptional regulator
VEREAGQGGGATVGAVQHAVRILRHLASQGRPLGVNAIARATGVNPSTCFNILRTLVAERLASFERESKTYRLGYGTLELALGLLGSNAADLIRPELERLALNYSALMGLWQVTDAERLILIDRVVADSAVHIVIRVGTRMPTVSGAVGRAVAAARRMDEEELRRRFAGLRWQRPIAFEAWHREIRETAVRGHAFDRGFLFKGIDAIGAAVVDTDGRPRYGLSAIAIAGQVDPDDLLRLGEELGQAAQRISRALFLPYHSE